MYRCKEIEYVRQIKELEEVIKKLKDMQRVQNETIELKSRELRKLKRFKNLEDQLAMREYLKLHVVLNMDEKNIDLILNKCGFNGKPVIRKEEGGECKQMQKTKQTTCYQILISCFKTFDV